MNLDQAVRAFFTCEVRLYGVPDDLPVRSIWWELRDGWLRPWRICRRTPKRRWTYGYPCGEPKLVDEVDRQKRAT